MSSENKPTIIPIKSIPTFTPDPLEPMMNDIFEGSLKTFRMSLKRLDNIKDNQTRSIVFLDRMLTLADLANGLLLQFMTHAEPELRQEIKTVVDMIQKEISNVYEVLQKDVNSDKRSF